MCREPDKPLLEAEADEKNFAYCGPLRRYNHNAVINWGLKMTAGWADSIWSNTVLAVYLYELMGKSNAYAGYVEAAQGISTLVVALPAGWAADRGSKSSIVRRFGLVVPFAVALSAFAVVYGVDHEESSQRAVCFTMLVAALCLWGGIQAVQNGPAQVLRTEMRTPTAHSATTNFSSPTTPKMYHSTLRAVVASPHLTRTALTRRRSTPIRHPREIARATTTSSSRSAVRWPLSTR